jgi:uncharacterized protein HemX
LAVTANSNVGSRNHNYAPQQQNSRANLRVIEGSKRKPYFSAKLYAVSFVLMWAAVGAIFSRIQLTEITEKINQSTKELETLEGDELILRTKLEDKINAANVEEQAAELGMVKIRKYQVEYINISGKD